MVFDSDSMATGGDESSCLLTRRENRSSDRQQQHDIKRKCFKNLLFLALVNILVFTAYTSLQNLQATLNVEAGIGVGSLASIYGCFVISSLCGPIVIYYTGYKWTVVLCFVAHCLFAASNFWPELYTIIPASVLLGLITGPYWISIATYITTLALTYSRVVDVENSVGISRFNGIFFTFFQTTQIPGNLISSLILYGNTNKSDIRDVTECGHSYCNSGNATENTIEQPDAKTTNILVAALLGCCVAGLIIAILVLDKVTPSDTNKDISLLKTVKSSVLIYCQSPILLLVPMFLYNGFESAFLFAEYTQAYVACELGIGAIGYTMTSFGVANSVSSLLVGRLEKYVGRCSLFILAALIHMVLCIYLLKWNVDSGETWIFYFIPGLWGVADAVLQTTTSTMIAVVFSHCLDPAFAVFRTWQSIGLTIALAYSFYLCTDIKIYIVVAVLTVGIVLYVVMEVVLKLRVTVKRISTYTPL